MKHDKTVSVVIPVYNGSAYLCEAIESVLTQTYPSVELIVIDDGSTDDSGTVAESYAPDLIYTRQERSGSGAARNAGVRLSSGRLTAFLDADDRFLPDKLSREAGVLNEREDLDGVRAHLREFVSPDLDDEMRATIRSPLERVPALYGYATMRRNAFERLGGFTTSVQVGEGVDFSARWQESRLQSLLLDDVLCERRLHGSNTWNREANRRSDFALTIRAALDRRRRVPSARPSGELGGTEET